MSNSIPLKFKPGMMVLNGIKGAGKILITINEDRKAFIAWADGSRSWVDLVDIGTIA